MKIFNEDAYIPARDPREVNVAQRIQKEAEMKAALPKISDDPICMNTLGNHIAEFTAEMSSPTELVLQSASGKKFLITVDDTGSVNTTPAIQTIEDLRAAIEKGGTITLTENIVIDEQIIIPKDVDVKLVLKGINMYINYKENYAFVAKGNLTIEGEGSIIVTGYGFSTSFGTPGTITINGGTYEANECDYLFGCFGGTITINDGTFNGEYCVINNFCDYYNKEGEVIINGGTLNAENPVLGSPVTMNI